MTDRTDITELLRALSDGRREALDELIPLIYEELRRIAHRHLQQERTGHTLNTTGLVHEAYLKLVDVRHAQWKDRAHFLAMASRAMRRILIDYARTRGRQKRGGDQIQITLNEAFHVAAERSEDLIALDEALQRLEATNERRCRLVECTFFGGMTLKEAAEALGISLSTAKRDWTVTRAWLNHELGAET